ncbi:hypothetical protein T492DRAFT_1071461 [Pavlovales sp. CCMP2436]|nr:hypothetical protein T492DRAFT_1071461 [Pavlovales sp. CCMP2436]|mmetsp:Transcript_4908/g.12605  ORF Transcript_4908/g.12605 Transcript_4908/m.12605 type:complete len:189 (-) Transcript_4908:204-770(-)
MGKNAGKPTRKTAGAGGSDTYEDAWGKREFHSQAYQQQELQLLLNAPERLTWDEWKAQQTKKKEEEEAEFYGVGMDMVKYRQQLDEERETRLDARREVHEKERLDRAGDKKAAKKAKSDKHKKEKDKGKRKSKAKKRQREKGSGDESSDSSSSSEDARKKRKEGKEMDSKNLKLSNFFNAKSDDSDAL